jgi:hypothetical protein
MPLAALSLGLSGLPATPGECAETARGGAWGSAVCFSPFAVGSPGRFPGAGSAGSSASSSSAREALPGGFTLHAVPAPPSERGVDEGEVEDEGSEGGAGAGAGATPTAAPAAANNATPLLAMAVVSPCTSIAAGDSQSLFVLGGVAGGLVLACGASEACGQVSAAAAHAGLPASHWDVEKALAPPSAQGHHHDHDAFAARAAAAAAASAAFRALGSEAYVLQPLPLWVFTGLHARRADVSAALAAARAGPQQLQHAQQMQPPPLPLPQPFAEHWVTPRDATSAAAGKGHSCVTLRDGSAWAWGENGSLQCCVVNRRRPHRVLLPGSGGGGAQGAAATFVAAAAAAAAGTRSSGSGAGGAGAGCLP